MAAFAPLGQLVEVAIVWMLDVVTGDVQVIWEKERYLRFALETNRER